MIASLVKTVGLVSDTHGRLSAAAFAALADCDYIIHAGDICSPEVLRELETLAAVYAVLGNNDYAEYGEAVGQFAQPVIEGVRFLVAHYREDIVAALKGRALFNAGGPCRRCAYTDTPMCRKSLPERKPGPLRFSSAPAALRIPGVGQDHRLRNFPSTTVVSGMSELKGSRSAKSSFGTVGSITPKAAAPGAKASGAAAFV